MLLVLFAALISISQSDDLVAQHASAAAAAMKAADYVSAERENRTIVQLRPEMAEAKVNLGLSLFLQKKYVDASQAFEAALKLRPELVNAVLFLGISRFNLNRASAALAPLKRYSELRPTDLQGQYYLGVTYLELERYVEAERPLMAAHRIDPRNVDVLYHLAQCYLGEGRLDNTKHDSLVNLFRNTVEQMAAIDPSSFRLAQLQAGLFELEGNNDKATGELEKILEHDPRASGLHYALGCLYIEQRQYEKARRQLEAELTLASPYPRTYLQLGHVYVALERPAEALPLLQKGLLLDPKGNGLVWVDVGRAYRSQNEPKEAEAAFEKAIKLGQDNASVYYQLAIVAKKSGDLERARQALTMSQKLRGEDDHSQP